MIDINKLEQLICGGGNIMLVELCSNFYLVSGKSKNVST